MINQEIIKKDFELAMQFVGKHCEKKLEHKMKLFDEYVKAKEWLFPFFGEDGRIETEIEVEDSEKQFDKDFFMNTFADQLEKMMAKNEKYHELPVSLLLNYFTRFIDNFEGSEIMGNLTTHTKHFGDKTIKTGTKVSKMLASIQTDIGSSLSYKMRRQIKIEGETKEETIERCDKMSILAIELLQNVYSVMLTMSKDQKVTVVLSINPMDFLLVAQHTTGWRSCHSWIDGEYRVGVFSYMTDNVSTIAYSYMKKAPYENLGIKTDPIGVKKWRQMVFFDVNNNSILHSREYPQANLTMAKGARMLSAKVLSDMKNVPYNWTVKTLAGRISKNSQEDDDLNAKYNLTNKGKGYCDQPTAILKLKDIGKDPNIIIGNIYSCPICGNPKNDGHNNRLVCADCKATGLKCYHCGVRIESEDDDYRVDNRHYCESCYDDLFEVCDSCGETISRDDAHYIFDETYCSECAHEKYFYCNECDNWFEHDSSVEVDGNHMCHDCANRRYSECDECGMYVDPGKITFVNGESICSTCCDNKYAQCSDCGEFFEIDELQEVNGQSYCKDCFEIVKEKDEVNV